MVDKEETNIGAHALLLTSDSKVILQQRTNDPDITNPGKISMFGGTLKSKDKVLDGLRRELQEELEIDTENYEVEKLGTYLKTKEIDGVDYIIHVYLIETVDLKTIKVHEGEGYILDKPAKLVKNNKLTRITKLALVDLIKQEN